MNDEQQTVPHRPAPRGRRPRRFRRILAVFALLAFGLASLRGADAATEKRVALVIGNGGYGQGAALRNPPNDAQDIARRLTQLGFETTLLVDAGQRKMSRALTRLGERVDANTVALFYFAGHGVQSAGRNFLLPADAQVTSESAVFSEAIDLERVLAQLRRARVSLVMIDACRNNPFAGSFRSLGRGLAQVDAPKGTLIAYATAPGNVAGDGEGRNSPYTGALLHALENPARPVEEVFKEVRRSVSKVTGDQQVPWESSSLTGDFYFKLPSDAARIPTQSLGKSALQIEDDLWNDVVARNVASGYAAYLREYPDGRYASAAKVRMSMLGAGGAQAAQRVAAPPAPAAGTAPVPEVATALERLPQPRAPESVAPAAPPAAEAAFSSPADLDGRRFVARDGPLQMAVRGDNGVLDIERFTHSLVDTVFSCGSSIFSNRIEFGPGLRVDQWCSGSDPEYPSAHVVGTFPHLVVELSGPGDAMKLDFVERPR